MRPAKWIFALASLALSSALHASNVQGVQVAHSEPLQHFRMAQTATLGDAVDGRRTVSFDALGRTFDLELRTNSSLLPRSTRTALGRDVGVYRGQLAGNADSWVRLVIADGMPRGLIWDGTELLAIEAAGDAMVEGDGSHIFRMADVSVAPGIISCGASSSFGNGAAMYRGLVGELRVAAARAPGAIEEIEVGAIGDFEFTNAMGADAATAIATRLNNVDGIFSQQLAIQITVNTIETFADSNDPFTDETDAGELLDEVASYRASTPAQSQAGLTHLYTGRNLNGTTAGIAFVGALCSTNFGAGLAEGRRGPTLDSLISAHEIGHNFGADHDGDADGTCPDEPLNFIMAPSVGVNNDSFGQCSIDVMAARAAIASCVTPLPAVDMTVSALGQPTTLLLGSTANITFDVDNAGTLDATGVTATINLPTSVSLVSSTSSQGSCTNGAGTVSCSLGAIGGGSGATVSISATADTVGAASFSASVTADVDNNGNNNQTVLQATIDPAVDLAVNNPSSPSVTLNQATTVTASVANSAILAASGVTATITLDAGLRPDSATLAGGDCTINGQQVDCTLAALAAQSSVNLSVGVTGLTAGTQGYTVSVAAAEAEAQPANNSASGSVNVTTSSGGGANGGGNDGGSGGTGPLLLLALCAALLRRGGLTLRPLALR